MKKRIVLFGLLSLTLVLLTGCFSDSDYSQIEEGEWFGINRDGYNVKLPYGYILDVYLGESTKLLRIPEDLTDMTDDSFDSALDEAPVILEGWYVKGYFDSKKLYLREEIEMNKFDYVIFDFETQETQTVDNLDDMKIMMWISLMNPMEESMDKE